MDKFKISRNILLLGNWGIILPVACIIIIGFCCTILTIFTTHYIISAKIGFDNNIDVGHYGGIGDYIGGIIGTLLALVGAFLLFFTLLIQSEQLRVQQIELSKTEEDTKDQKIQNVLHLKLKTQKSIYMSIKYNRYI